MYTAYDSSGTAVVTGTLSVNFSPVIQSTGDVEIDGSWEFDPVVSGAMLGNQIGRGNYKGIVYPDSSFMIDTHAGWADNNFVLSGKPLYEGATRFGGTWQQLLFVGLVAEGTFSAVEK